MKIVKVGKWHLPWTTEVVCGTCEAILLVEEKDVKPTFDKNDKFYCVCAACGKSIDIPAKEIAMRVREEVGAKRTYRSYSSSWD